MLWNKHYKTIFLFETNDFVRKQTEIFVLVSRNKVKQTQNRSCFGLFRFKPKYIFVCFEDTLVRTKIYFCLFRSHPRLGGTRDRQQTHTGSIPVPRKNQLSSFDIFCHVKFTCNSGTLDLSVMGGP
jgi:hypothetical protein